MRLRTLKLSRTQKNELYYYRDHDRRPDVRERCAAILKIGQGQSPHAVAHRGLLKPRKPDTVYGWLNRYEQMGIEGLLTARHGGNRRQPFRATRGGAGTVEARAR